MVLIGLMVNQFYFNSVEWYIPLDPTLTQTLSRFINNFYWELIWWELTSRELISWEVDLVGVDLVGVDFMGVDLVGMAFAS